MRALAGFTGFVGGNLAAAGAFTGLYNSKNIEEAFGSRPDILYYAAVPAEKFTANKFPEEDEKIIRNAQENIRKIAPQRVVLISTVDVYDGSFPVTETDAAKGNGAYGKNRRMLEAFVEDHYPDHLIVRLPGLFGRGIKKNFIYDYIHFIPSLLNESKFTELSAQKKELIEYYKLNEKGFYACKAEGMEERALLRKLFEEVGFSALNFTDSRAVYQFYDLSDLYGDIERAAQKGISLLNIATEPVRSSEVYQYLTGHEFVNELPQTPADYDMRTIHYKELDGCAAADANGGYLYRKEEILKRIKNFTDKEITV
jgi:hypothetical protein